MSKLIYLASPYSDPDPGVQRQRFLDACEAAAHLVRQGHLVFSPIAHSHPIALCGLPGDWVFWAAHNREWLARCDELWVLRLPGWSTSQGVGKEQGMARDNNQRIRYVDWPITENP